MFAMNRVAVEPVNFMKKRPSMKMMKEQRYMTMSTQTRPAIIVNYPGFASPKKVRNQEAELHKIVKEFDQLMTQALKNGEFGVQDPHQRTFKAAYNLFLREVLSPGYLQRHSQSVQ